MIKLTKQEQIVLALILFLLVTGWIAQAWRQSHASPPDSSQSVGSAP